MAKLYIQKTGGTAVACNIYNTAAEAGDKALRVGNGYVALKPITDANATAGRVSVGGVTYAIATKHESGGGASVPYTENLGLMLAIIALVSLTVSPVCV